MKRSKPDFVNQTISELKLLSPMLKDLFRSNKIGRMENEGEAIQYLRGVLGHLGRHFEKGTPYDRNNFLRLKWGREKFYANKKALEQSEEIISHGGFVYLENRWWPKKLKKRSQQKRFVFLKGMYWNGLSNIFKKKLGLNKRQTSA